MTDRQEKLRAALDAVVTNMTWTGSTGTVHSAEAWRTLVGTIVMATNGDNDGQVPMGAMTGPQDDFHASLVRNDVLDVITRSLASCRQPVRADELLRNIEECGYTFRLTTPEERRAKNDAGSR